MTLPLAVFFTERAPAVRAQWLQKLLEPLAAACKMQQAPPLEIRPTGCAGGWADSAKLAPDRRVCISSKIVFYGPDSIRYIYLHESAHRFLEGKEIGDHGPEFFCFLAILLVRSSGFFSREALQFLDLYDLQDRPEEVDDEGENWRGTVLNWSLKTAAELASTDTAAESLANVVCMSWQEFLTKRQVNHVAAAKAAADAVLATKRQTELVVDLKHSRTLWRCLGGLGWLMFMVLTWLNVRGFQ